MSTDLPNQGEEGFVQVSEGTPEDTTPATPQTAPAPAAAPEQAAPEQPQVPRSRPMSPNDAKRLEIAKRYNERRTEAMQSRPFQNVNSDENFGEAGFAPPPAPLTPEPGAPEPGVPDHAVSGDHAPQAQPPAAPDTPPPPAERKHKVKVRHGEILLSDDELFEAARKGLAGESYLEESRWFLDQAKALREASARPPQDVQTPVPAASGQQPAAPSPPQEPDFEAMANKIQYGEPGEVAELLKQLYERPSQVVPPPFSQPQQPPPDPAELVRREMVAERLRNDLATSQKYLDDFRKANPDVANDEFSWAAAVKAASNMFREDILKLGIVEDSQLTTEPVQLADFHRLLRIQNAPVRPFQEIVQETAKRIRTWRGTSQPQQQQPAREGAPRVEVNRTARREAIPQQPTRTVPPSPLAAATPAPSREDSTSAYVQEQRRLRGYSVASPR